MMAACGQAVVSGGGPRVDTPPLAVAGPSRGVSTGGVVTLDASGSTDADGDALTYSWSLSLRPAGSSASLSDASAVHPTFTADVDGTYVVQLVVYDGQLHSAPTVIFIKAAVGNTAPVASAGAAQRVAVGATVTLDGSASSDADGDLITYTWTLATRPAGSTAALTNATSVHATFVPDVAGDYVLQLIVNDGQVDSPPATVTITAAAGNSAPVASAGPAQNVTVGTTVTLNGTGSSDVDGDALTYSWSFTSRPGGSSAALTGATSAHPTFVPDLAGSYVVQLIVNDGKVDSTPATVTVTAAVGNSAPVASAGPAQNVTLGATVTLDGTASSDADADPLTYSWSFSSRPTGSAASLTGATSAHPTFVPDAGGAYVVRLVVNDGHVNSAAATVTITANTPPVASAGPAQNVTTGATVTLDGTASSDADGDTLTYSWSFTSRPTGSAATLTSATSAHPAFVPDVAGSYVVRLVVSDGRVSSTPATVTVTAAVGNSAPVASAGPAQSGTVGATVTLDGTGSTDADGDTLTYSWSFSSRPTGSAASLTGATSAHPTFVPDVGGAYVVRLVVNDGHVNSAAATVTITANTPPVASAGPLQNVPVGTTVTLDGSASSDADADPLTYSWSFTSRPGGSSAALTAATSAHPTFVADVAGSYVVRLVVNDGRVSSTPATVTVTAAVGNSAPVASAGPAQNVTIGATVTLDGTASSDADADPLTYSWSFQSTPPGNLATLTNATSAHPTFVPNVAGSYVVQLVVNDGQVNSAASTVTITSAIANSAPVASAGPAQNVAVATTVTLDGSASSDADGDLLTYQWTFGSRPAGSAAALTNATSVHPTFVPDVAGSYVVQLIVNDGKVNGTPATVTVTAAVANSAPVASAGAAQNVGVGATVTLDGTGSTDADGDPLTYAWSFTSCPTGSAASLTGATSAHPIFAPDLPGDYVVRLVVNDGHVDSNPVTVTVTASAANSAPVAKAGPGRYFWVGWTVVLDGSASSDADGDPLTYAWAFVSVPGTSAATLGSATSAHPTFVPDVAGDYVIRLIVNDGQVDSAPATVTITINNPATTTFTPTKTFFGPSYVDYTASDVANGNINFLAQASPVSLPPIRFSNIVAGRLRLYDFDLTSYAINYNGSNLTPNVYADGGNIPIANLDRWVSMPYAATPGPVTFTVYTNYSSTCASAQVLLLKADGTILKASTLCGGTPASPLATSVTFVDPANTEVFIAYTRGTDSGGGIRIWKTELTVTNSPPVGSAGAAQSVPVGATVTLDGTGSTDADGDPLTYAWSFTSRPAGSAATLASSTSAHPTFVPDVSGDYVVQLVVNDGHASGSPATVQIQASLANTPPVADAGQDQHDWVGATVTLDGGGSSDANGDPLGYAWTLSSVPVGSAAALTNPATAHPTFVPDLPGDYVLQLVVNDGQADSAPATVTVTATVPVTTTFTPTRTFFGPSYVDYTTADAANANINFLAQASPVSLPPIRFSNIAAGRLRLYDLDLTSYAINYNGSNLTPNVYADGGNIPIANIDRWVSMPYAATPGPVTFTVYTTYSSTCAAAQVLLLKTDGTILKASTLCGGTPASPLATSVTFVDPANTEVFVAYTRGTDSGGGIRIWATELTR